MIEYQEDPPIHMATKDAAEYLGLSHRSLEKWRTTGTGPSYLKLGRKVLYDLASLEEWRQNQMRQKTTSKP